MEHGNLHDVGRGTLIGALMLRVLHDFWRLHFVCPEERGNSGGVRGAFPHSLLRRLLADAIQVFLDAGEPFKIGIDENLATRPASVLLSG